MDICMLKRHFGNALAWVEYLSHCHESLCSST